MANACTELEKKWWKAKERVWKLQTSSPIQPVVDDKFVVHSGEIVRKALIHQQKLNKAREEQEAFYEELVNCYGKFNLFTDASMSSTKTRD